LVINITSLIIIWHIVIGHCYAIGHIIAIAAILNGLRSRHITHIIVLHQWSLLVINNTSAIWLLAGLGHCWLVSIIKVTSVNTRPLSSLLASQPLAINNVYGHCWFIIGVILFITWFHWSFIRHCMSRHYIGYHWHTSSRHSGHCHYHWSITLVSYGIGRYAIHYIGIVGHTGFIIKVLRR